MPLDEVKPGNKITAQLKKLMLPQAPARRRASGRRLLAKKLKLSLGERAK